MTTRVIAGVETPGCTRCGNYHFPTPTDEVRITRVKQYATPGRAARYAWKWCYDVAADGCRFSGNGLSWAEGVARKYAAGRPVVKAWEG